MGEKTHKVKVQALAKSVYFSHSQISRDKMLKPAILTLQR